MNRTIHGTRKYGVVLALCWALHADRAHGQSAPSLVVIVTSDPASPIARRVGKDLQGIGLDVLVLKATPENSSGRESLERSARSVGAIAAVRLVAAGDGTEVWVADRITGKTVIRELMGPTGSQAEPEDVAVGTVELLRASLMELHSPSAPHGDAIAEVSPPVRELAMIPPPETKEVEKPYAPRLSITAAPGIDFGLRSVGPSLQSSWAAWVGLGASFGARAFVSLPLLAEHTDIAEGTVDVAATILGVGATYDLAQPDKLLVPFVGLGASLARVATIGTAAPPFGSSSESGWFGGGYGQIGMGLRMARGLRLHLDITGVALASPPNVRADLRTVGHWGAPAGIASLGLEVLWGR